MKYRPVYCLVTRDEARLIRAMADSPAELAEMIGRRADSVRRAFAKKRLRSTKNGEYELVWMEVDGE